MHISPDIGIARRSIYFHVLIEAVKEQQQMIEEMKRKIGRLEKSK